jgi:uncharacterized protein YcbK (DUF882 family)
MGDLSRNLSRHEFTCHCGCGFDDVEPLLVMLVQSMCIEYGTVNLLSGCRCPTHNKDVGGGSASQHLKGKAGDCEFKTGTPKEWAAFADEIYGQWIGIGIYQTFVHVDVRGHPARWKG